MREYGFVNYVNPRRVEYCELMKEMGIKEEMERIINATNAENELAGG